MYGETMREILYQTLLFNISPHNLLKQHGNTTSLLYFGFQEIRHIKHSETLKFLSSKESIFDYRKR